MLAAYLILVAALVLFLAGAFLMLYGAIEVGGLAGAAAAVLAVFLIVGSFFIAGAGVGKLPPRRYRVTVVQVPPPTEAARVPR